MQKEDLLPFLNKKVKINIIVDSKELFYHGVILLLNDDTVTFKDKFGKRIVTNITNVVKVEEILENDDYYRGLR